VEFPLVVLWGRAGAALAVRSHFFEFVSADGKVRLAHELSDGAEYSVLLTTSGGLWRYPAKYGETGRRCFVLLDRGLLYQADLGAETAKAVERMSDFSADEKWTTTGN
jgi:hypothetical protein